MNLRARLSIKDLLWIVLLIAAATGWSIDHHLAENKHNATAGKIARLAPIEAVQQEKVHELRTKLEKERAKGRRGTDQQTESSGTQRRSRDVDD
jgi:hypothetical protein